MYFAIFQNILSIRFVAVERARKYVSPCNDCSNLIRCNAAFENNRERTALSARARLSKFEQPSSYKLLERFQQQIGAKLRARLFFQVFTRNSALITFFLITFGECVASGWEQLNYLLCAAQKALELFRFCSLIWLRRSFLNAAVCTRCECEGITFQKFQFATWYACMNQKWDFGERGNWLLC